jgi:hypothetical protein
LAAFRAAIRARLAEKSTPMIFLNSYSFGKQERPALATSEIYKRELRNIRIGQLANAFNDVRHRSPKHVGIDRLVIGGFGAQPPVVNHSRGIASGRNVIGMLLRIEFLPKSPNDMPKRHSAAICLPAPRSVGIHRSWDVRRA